MITIGLPVFNAEKYLRFTLESILSQTYTNWFLIIVNDGSTDSSDAIIQQYIGDSRIRYINSKKNKGLIYRLNQLIDLTETKYYFRMDSDDIMHPDRLLIQLDFLEKNPTIDLLGTAAISIDESNFIVGIKTKTNNFSRQNVLLANPFIHPSTAGKTSWFKINTYNQRYYRAEDKELWLRTYAHSNFYNLNVPLLYYREGKVNIRNYLATGRTIKIIYKDNHGLFLTRSEYKWTLIKVDIKNIIYRIATLLNSQGFLASMRSKKMLPSQKSNYEKVLKDIL